MKKIYAFFAAALISVCAFASKDVIPSDAVLANYYDAGQVCVAIFVPADMACFDVVLTGTYNDWSDKAANCVKFEPVDNYDGWYVAAVDDDGLDANGTPYENLQEKPVMLDVDGNFNWAYQVGSATYVRGGVTIVEGGIPGEIDLKTYGTDAPNVFTVDSWKSNPCTAVYHNYNLQVISDGCGYLAVPFLIGGMNNWTAQEMQIDQAKTQELGAPCYYLNFKAAEGTEYQLLSGLRDVNTGEIDSTAAPGWYDEAYLQVYVDGMWQRYNPSNTLLGEEPNIVYDLRVDTMRWARCDESPALDITVTLTAPAGAPAAGVEIIGFDGWDDADAVLMTANAGKYTANISAKETAEFKFREKGSWENQILVYVAEGENADTWAEMANIKIAAVLNKDNNTITLDFSDANQYKWTNEEEEGIENVVLSEKAQKVIVDGVLYIVRDNKLFNVQGAQVR